MYFSLPQNINLKNIQQQTQHKKVIEKIIYKRFYYYLNDNKILVNEQMGFRDKLSTDTATYALLNTVLSSLDSKNYVGGLFCDLEKASDCVNHDILLAKMTFYGITGIAHNLIRSYLTNRYQRTKINQSSSTWERINHGVPQGSVLGPLLFLIYINDFLSAINKLASTVLFADDTSIILSNMNPDEFMNSTIQVMNEIIEWFQSNLLSLNFNKTTFIQFITKKNGEIAFQITNSNSIITNINNTKFLGIMIDSTLSWNEQITSLASKLNKACYAIRMVKSCMSHEVLRMMYFSYVHSIMAYGIIFWGNSHSSGTIFKIQKRIIRLINNSDRRESCRKLFQELQILPLASQYILSILIFVNKNRRLFLSNSDIKYSL